jgi:hypothetical protein
MIYYPPRRAVKIDIEDIESCQQAFETFIGQLDTSDYSIALYEARTEGYKERF